MTTYQWMISHGKNNNVMWLILNGENFTGQLSLALSDRFVAMILNWLDCISPFTTHAIKWNVAVVVLRRLFSYGGVQSGTKGRSRPDYSSLYLLPQAMISFWKMDPSHLEFLGRVQRKQGLKGKASSKQPTISFHPKILSLPMHKLLWYFDLDN